MPDRRFLAPTLPQHLLRRAALVVGLLAAAAAGCQVCNDIGCDGGFEWNAETADGSGLAPGVYALEITLDGSVYAIDCTLTDAVGESDCTDPTLVEGDGTELQLGQTAYVHLIAYRGDTGEQVASTWESGQPQGITYVEDGSLPGIIEGMAGMKVGGRRQMVIPYEDAFGPEGNPDLGVPANTDLVLVIDLIAAF